MKWPRWLPARWLVGFIPGAALLAVLGAIAGFVVVFTGAYNVAATEPHLLPVYRLLDIAMRQSVRARAADIEVPALDDPRGIALGSSCYRQYCVQCHGAPGIAPDESARGLMPLPASLVQTALDWPPEELYWVTRHGIRTTGMPAWQFRMSEEALWATVAFLEVLPALTVERYAAMSASAGPASCPEPVRAPTAAQVERGRTALHQYACITCHRIPGIPGPHTYVGPPLAHMARRTYIAGVVPNTVENMVRWLRDPPGVSPLTLMPDLGVSEADARDIAAYLATLEESEPWSAGGIAATRARAAPRVAATAEVEAGRQALARFGCTSCHAIPGVPGPRGLVGPPLDAWSRHPYIAGKFPNEPEVLVQWIVDPPSLAPETAMPDSGVTEPEARDMAAYLYALE